MKKVLDYIRRDFLLAKPHYRIITVVICCVAFILCSRFSNIISVAVRIGLVLVLAYYVRVRDSGD